MCRTFWHGWKSEIWWNMIKGSLLGDYQMENLGTLGSCATMYLVHTSYIYIYRFYRAFWGILREQIVRVPLPTFSLGDYHERLDPTPYHFFRDAPKTIQPFIPFWGEQTFKFTVTFRVFPVVFFFFSGCASKTPTPLKRGQRCDCFNHHLRKLKSRTSGITSGWMYKGKPVNLPSFWGKWIVGFYLGFIANPVFFVVCCFRCKRNCQFLHLPNLWK